MARDGVGRALDDEHQLPIARQRAARAVLEGTTEGARAIGVGRADGAIAVAVGLGRRGGPARLQPDALARFEVDGQQAQRGVGEDRAVDRQRHAGRQERQFLVGVLPPLRLELPSLLRMAGQRHAVPRHEQRTGGRHQAVARGVAAVHQPVARRSAERSLRLADEVHEPVEPASGGKGNRHVAAADAGHGAARRAGLVEDRGGGDAVAGTKPGDGPHHRQRGLIAGGGLRAGEPVEPGRSRERLVRLEGLDRDQQRRTVTRGRVEPASGHGHDPRRVIGRDGLLEEAIGAGAKLQFIGFATGPRQPADEPVGLRLDALPGALLLHAEEEVLVGGEDFVEQGRRITPAFVGEQTTGAVELAFAEPVARKADRSLACLLFRVLFRAGLFVDGGGILAAAADGGHAGEHDEEDAGNADPADRPAMTRPGRGHADDGLLAGAASAGASGGSSGVIVSARSHGGGSHGGYRPVRRPVHPAFPGPSRHGSPTGAGTSPRPVAGEETTSLGIVSHPRETGPKAVANPGEKRRFRRKTLPCRRIRAVFRPESRIYLGCNFIPRVSNQPAFGIFWVPGSGTRWGIAAHNFWLWRYLAMAKKSGSKPLTKTEIMRSISETTGLQKKDVVAVMEALTDEIQKALKGSGTGVFSIPGLVKIERRKVPARPAQKGVKNPFTGELQDRPAKPASVKVRVRALKNLKAMVSH